MLQLCVSYTQSKQVAKAFVPKSDINNHSEKFQVVSLTFGEPYLLILIVPMGKV